MKKILLILLFFCISQLHAQSNFQLNSSGISYLYWPFPNSSYSNPGQWAITGYNHGQGDHLGGDYYAEDWNLPGSADCGVEFKSPLSGTVIFAGEGGEGGYGKQVVVRSTVNSNFAFRIAHLSAISVSNGQTINNGQKLGEIGTTGSSTGCHAHTVLYKNITSTYSGSTTGLQRLQSGLGLGFSGGPNTFAAQYLYSATSTGSVSCNWSVNSNPLQGWKFWKTPQVAGNIYSVTVNISGGPSQWGLHVFRNGSYISSVETSHGGTSYTFNFSVHTSEAYPDGGGYYFRLSQANNYNASVCESPQFYISRVPNLSISKIPAGDVHVGQNVTLEWNVTGGIPGLPNGGWTGNIRFQWYQNDMPKANLAHDSVSHGSYPFNVPPSIQGAIVPGNNFKIAGVNADVGTSMPGGTVFAFTPPFNILATSSIISEQGIIPSKFDLSQNYPNPFNPETKIKFDIPAGSKEFVELRIYNISGEEVSTLVNEELSTGRYEVSFDGSNLASGVYYYKLITRTFTDTKQMVLVK